MALANDTVRYKLKYVGGAPITNVRYIHIKDGTNDLTFFDQTVADIEGRTFVAGASTLNVVIESVPLFVPIFVSQITMNSVTGHLSTHRDNYVKYVEGSSSNFSFGTYFGESPVFNVRLGGQFHVKDGEFHTFNALYKGMRNITSWSKTLFIDYYKGTTDGTTPIVGLKETFMDNSSLIEIVPGMLQYIPAIQSIRRCWANNTSLAEVKDGVFSTSPDLVDGYEAFMNTKVSKLPPRFIAIG